MTKAIADPLIFGKYTVVEFAQKLIESVSKRKVSVEDGSGGGDNCILDIESYVQVYVVPELTQRIDLLGNAYKEPGYEIGRVRVQHNYPFEPDDYDFEGEDDTKSLVVAIQRAVAMWLEDEVARESNYLRESIQDHYYPTEGEEEQY